jgi:hypothetical protein
MAPLWGEDGGSRRFGTRLITQKFVWSPEISGIENVIFGMSLRDNAPAIPKGIRVRLVPSKFGAKLSCGTKARGKSSMNILIFQLRAAAYS